MKHSGLIRKTANRITQAQQKAPKPKDDTQIPRPDLRFAIERKQRSKTKNGARAQTKHPEQKHKICQVTQGECPTVSSKTCTMYKKQSGTQRETKHVLTLTLLLVRRKSACKTSAGSSKILRWLTPLLGPNLDPKMGPKQRPKRRNENVIQFWTPFWGQYLDPKMGSAIGEFRCCPHMLCKQICDPAA